MLWSVQNIRGITAFTLLIHYYLLSPMLVNCKAGAGRI
jgi:protein tyrosine phosphatase